MAKALEIISPNEIYSDLIFKDPVPPHTILRSMGAKDIRINQQQVNNQMCRVGIYRPDVQATLRDSNKQIYIEYDRASSNRGAGHASRALSNDPDAIVILRTVD
jgi:hypothetical protein